MFIRVILASLALMVAVIGTPAYAVLEIDITKGNVEPMPIALPFMHGESDAEEAMGEDLTRVIEANLERSGLFRSLNRGAFLQENDPNTTVPTFANWRQVNATALLKGKVIFKNPNEFEVEFRLWDVYLEKQISGKVFATNFDNWRRIAHLISDVIYEQLSGETGYFDTRIVYVSERGDPQNRAKRLAIMDQDGANHRFLTDGSYLVLTPRFSPKSNKVIYMSYEQRLPKVFILNVDTGHKELVGKFDGMTFAPRFSPDGKSVIMSASLNGNSEIFLYNLETRKQARLTYNDAIDTSPSFSPDGKSIVFNSDRAGSQQLYVMDRSGKNVRRISYGKHGRYGTPVWSPRGDLIAFTKMYQGKFYIGVMETDGSGERLLTESYLDEGPTWSPNGRVIIFARQTRSTLFNPSSWGIYSIDLTGYNERKIPIPFEGSDPAWSPML